MFGAETLTFIVNYPVSCYCHTVERDTSLPNLVENLKALPSQIIILEKFYVLMMQWHSHDFT